MDGAGGRGVIFFFWSRGGMSKNLYDVRGWKKFAPLKKYPLSPQPDTEVYIMKGEIFNKGFCYLQDDIKSQIILKKNQFFAFKFPTVRTTKRDKSYFQFNKPLFLKQLFLVSSQFSPLVYQSSCAEK